MRDINERIKVFISSKIGVSHADEKYTIARKAVKEILESTGFFTVYTFEDMGASIMSAEKHYERALIDSDVCIFLIDNKDGVPSGVQIELELADKYKKQTLYYFCNQWTNKKTQLQRSLEKASKPKHINIVSFASFVERCPKDFVESILSTFINSGKSLNIEEDFINDQLTIEDQNEKFQQSLSSKSGLLISKKSLENCLCRNYFDNLLFDDELIDSSDMPKNFDFYCTKFLTTMFENNPIDNVNMILFLENLKSLVPEYYFQIIPNCKMKLATSGKKFSH